MGAFIGMPPVAVVRVTYRAMRSSPRIRCTDALMSAGREKVWGKFPRCRPVCGSISCAYSHAVDAINGTGGLAH